MMFFPHKERHPRLAAEKVPGHDMKSAHAAPLKYFSSLVAILMVVFGVSGLAAAEEFVFETATARYVLSDNGTSRSLQAKKNGRELLVGSPAPFALVRKSGRSFPVTRLSRAGEFFRAEFGQSSVSADFRISAGPDRIVFELARLNGTGVDEVRLAQLRVGGLANAGVLLTVSWDEQFAVSLMGLSDKVDSRFGEGMLVASVYRDYGMVGGKVALLAVPTPQLLDTVQKVEKEFELPTPKIGGSWAKSSPDARTSYLFTDLSDDFNAQFIHPRYRDVSARRPAAAFGAPTKRSRPRQPGHLSLVASRRTRLEH